MERQERARLGWRALVPVTALLAGVLFATSAHTAQGTDLRAGRFSELTDLIASAQDSVADQEKEAAQLRSDVAEASRLAAAGSTTVAAETSRGDALMPAAGLQALRGPGVVVTLDDAPPRPAGQAPASDNPDDLVVHQQDVQSVLNALWAGGADAVTLMGERLISTSAVRCVGNTLLIQGRLVGPPFVVRAIGDAGRMRAALDSEPGVALFRQYVDAFGLTFDVVPSARISVPAYQGTLDLPHVRQP
ncbi:MAG TPA: DUF881 domain-containing protein [Mycobacteriales bacterium]|nr:DUF881 domain-containing protein [Mycobacteriales bacterium]